MPSSGHRRAIREKTYDDSTDTVPTPVSNERPTTVRSLVELPSGWLPVVALSGAGGAFLGLLVTWVTLLAVGVSPGRSDAVQFVVGGPVSAAEGAIWFYFDAHWIEPESEFSNTLITASPLELADPTLWPLHAVPAVVVGVAGAVAVRWLRVADLLNGLVAGAATTLGYLPAMLLLWAVARVPLTRHATDGRVPISDAEGVPVSLVSGVTAGPDLAWTLLLVPAVSLTLGALGGAVATASPVDE